MTRKQRPVLSGPLAINEHFEPPAISDWRSIAERSLRGRSLSSLDSSTIEGLTRRPLYLCDGRGSQIDLDRAIGYPGQPPLVRGSRAVDAGLEGWVACQQIFEPEPASCATAVATELQRGAGAVWIEVDLQSRLGRRAEPFRLRDVGLGLCQASELESVLEALISASDAETGAMAGLHISGGGGILGIAAQLIAAWRRLGHQPAALRGTLACDPLGSLADDGELPCALETAFDQMADLVCWCNDQAPGLRSVMLGSLAYHRSGSSLVQELAFTVATGVEYLRQLNDRGVDPSAAFPQMAARLAIGRDLFMEIAKLRALRRLWCRVTEVVLDSVAVNEPEMPGLPVHAVTSSRALSVYDPWVNLLRGTVQTAAAVLGGAEVVTTMPFDAAVGEPDELARRMAINTQNILREESHLDRIVDPVGGSWYVERLTAELADSAWQLFQSIESRGGMLSTLRGGHVSELVSAARDERLRRLSCREDLVTGVSSFPNPDETRLERPCPRSRQRRAPSDSEERPLDGVLEALAQARATSANGSLLEAAIAAAESGASLEQMASALGHGERARLEPFGSLRDAQPFEGFRDAALEMAERHAACPTAFLAELGAIKEHKARSSFALGVLHAGGIETSERDGLVDPKAVVLAFQESRASVAVISSSDARYSEMVPSLVPALKQAGARLVMLVGNPGMNETPWRDVGVDLFLIEAKDVLDVIAGVHAPAEVAHA